MNANLHPNSAVATFYRIAETAVPPMRGDKSALGVLPSAAHQYCEPARTASSYGWYIFPPTDIRLKWDGATTFYAEDGRWCELTSIALSDEFVERWDAAVPKDLVGYWPPFMSASPIPGIVQIWSGLLVSTAPDWSLKIGPLVNMMPSRRLICYEGIVETDSFRPCPLFINVRIIAPDTEISIPRDKPLFQAQPVLRACYSENALREEFREGLPDGDEIPGMSEADWAGYRKTIRKVDTPAEEYIPGAYGAERRRRAKREREST